MNNLFKHAACMTDLHVGHKSNSKLHNEDCERFVDWFIAEAHARGAETCIFLGDWSHQRAAINVASMNTSIRLLKKLNDAFERVYFILGNHDLYYRDKRDINSIEYARDLSNFVFIDKPFTQGDVTIMPWLVGNEWKKVHKCKSKYFFGHLELPHFKMNAMVEMPDHGGLKAADFKGPEYVFSGHFHKRQYKGNIHYIGNAFPHNYADAGDNDRGAMFLKWGEEPEYVNWDACPKYRVMMLSELIDNHANLLDSYTHARVKLDIDVSYEEANFIREKFAEQYGARELQLMPVKNEQDAFEGGEIEFESVDHIVVSQIDTIESDNIDKKLLTQLYNGLTI